jgi:hypothetical protein
MALNEKANANAKAAKILRNFNASSLLRAIYTVYPKRD